MARTPHYTTHNIYSWPLMSAESARQTVDNGEIGQQSRLDTPTDLAVDLFSCLCTTLHVCLAGVEGDVIDGCEGVIVCLDCPRPWEGKDSYRLFHMTSGISQHCRLNPDHYIVFKCRSCDTHHSIATLLNSAGVGYKRRQWGGRRPGAGAPKHNLNAFKHWERSRDPLLQEFMAELEPERRLSAALFLQRFKRGEEPHA